jgi:acetyl esterase/lipase
MPLGPHLDLPYGALPRLKLDLYLPDASERCQGLIIFVHGGAWRSSSSRDPTLEALPTLMPQDYALAVINYRLSGQKDEEAFHWPGHPLDVKAGVEWLVGERQAGGLLQGERWRHARERVWFVGHSAGAVRAAYSGGSFRC